MLGLDRAVAVEAAVRFGGDRYLASAAGFVGRLGFGAAAPAEAMDESSGFTPAAVIAVASRLWRTAD